MPSSRRDYHAPTQNTQSVPRGLSRTGATDKFDRNKLDLQLPHLRPTSECADDSWLPVNPKPPELRNENRKYRVLQATGVKRPRSQIENIRTVAAMSANDPMQDEQ